MDSATWANLIERAPALDTKQRGHLRHWWNLSQAYDGVWDCMGYSDPGNEWLDAPRYQLAEIAYGSALAHFHRLPAARGYFKQMFKNLIRKMMRREVWNYWKDTSQSGIRVNPDIKELRKGWTDPVVEGETHTTLNIENNLGNLILGPKSSFRDQIKRICEASRGCLRISGRIYLNSASFSHHQNVQWPPAFDGNTLLGALQRRLL